MQDYEPLALPKEGFQDREGSCDGLPDHNEEAGKLYPGPFKPDGPFELVVHEHLSLRYRPGVDERYHWCAVSTGWLMPRLFGEPDAWNPYRGEGADPLYDVKPPVLVDIGESSEFAEAPSNLSLGLGLRRTPFWFRLQPLDRCLRVPVDPFEAALSHLAIEVFGSPNDDRELELPAFLVGESGSVVQREGIHGIVERGSDV